MEAKESPYDFEGSRKRMDEILSGEDTSYEEVKSIPGRDTLTFTNGYYVSCSCVFIDIRKSSDLPEKYGRPKLAKLYRAFISESAAAMTDTDIVSEVSIQGDGVWGVYDTPLKSDIEKTFRIGSRLNSVIDVLNCKAKSYGYSPITVGIGLAYGRALMVKAGYKGSGLNDVVWMGEVVNRASELSHWGNKTSSDDTMMVDNLFQQNLNDEQKKFLTKNENRGCYQGNVVRVNMNDWVKKNCP